ncbi:MAG: biotin--[acetyl-CoA-carboxylase] ligase [Candidatus Saccharibacteria bacterium]
MIKELLTMLAKQPGEYVAIEIIGRRLGLVNTEVVGLVSRMNKAGIKVDCSLERGCRLPEEKIDLAAQPLQIMLDGSFGRHFYLCNEVGSTNEWAKEEAGLRRLDEGTVFAARRQTAGKGRQGKVWQSPEGGLWFSLVLRPGRTVYPIASFSPVLALAVAGVLAQYTENVRVKWPNDVFVGTKKIAGILLEMHPGFDKIGYVIVGIGVNANNWTEHLPEDIGSISTSLAEDTGRTVSLNLLLARLIESVEDHWYRFKREGFLPFKQQFENICIHYRQAVTIDTGTEKISGLNVGLDENGGLLIDRGPGGVVTINSGDVLF